jgi:hypothetical protein
MGIRIYSPQRHRGHEEKTFNRGYTQIRGQVLIRVLSRPFVVLHAVFICVNLRPSAVKLRTTSVNSVSLW